MHDNADQDEQHTTDDPDAPATGGKITVPMQPRYGPRPGHLT
jgi:hypothetical protein